MSNVLLATDSSDLRTRIHDASGGTCIAVPSDPLPAEPMQLLAQLQHETLPDILVLDASRAPEAALALAARFDRELPGTGVVLIGNPDALSLADSIWVMSDDGTTETLTGEEHRDRLWRRQNTRSRRWTGSGALPASSS